MLDHNYPQYGKHSKRHAEMLDRLSQLKQDLVDDNNMVTVELAGYLSDWLIQHVAEEDTECGKFFNLKGIH
jgi:hemerythrin-like metal-binding protein